MGRKVEGRWNAIGVSVTSEPPAGPSDGERASDCPSPFSFNFLGRVELSKQAVREKGKERTDVVGAPPVSPSCPLLVDTVDCALEIASSSYLTLLCFSDSSSSSSSYH